MDNCQFTAIMIFHSDNSINIGFFYIEVIISNVETFHVFQHSLVALSNKTYSSIEILLKKKDPILDENKLGLYGNNILFNENDAHKGMRRGKLILDQDLNLSQEYKDLGYEIVKFPVAEYIFTGVIGPLIAIQEIYSYLFSDLKNKSLEAIYQPILSFPNDLPNDIETNTAIEIWLATNANLSDDNRLSSQLEEALPRTTFDFYRW